MQATAPESDLAASDLGPLAWVMDELRQSLDAAQVALRRHLREAQAAVDGAQPAPDTGGLRRARLQLHQSVGALEMVGLPGPAQLLRAMELAVQRFSERPELCTEAAASQVERAGFALAEYLEGRLAGKDVPAVALFPQYREVQALCGAERAHPADLWPQDWAWQEPVAVGGAPALAFGPAVRARMDLAVLRIVKSGDRAAAADLAALCEGLAAGQKRRESRSFWALAAGFFEALAEGLPADLFAKRAASRVLVQYAQQARDDAAVSERLAQDLAFFCAQARPEGAAPRLAAVRQAWQLERHAPVDYETPCYGRFDPALLAQARKRLAAAHEGWAALSGGDTSRLRSHGDTLQQLADALTRLHPPLAPLAAALSGAADDVMRQARPPQPALAMEAATAILFLEAVCHDFSPTDPTLDGRAARLAQRLEHAREGRPAEPLEPWIESLYRHVSDRQTMGSVVGELRTMLVELEKDLDAFFRQPGDPSPLGPVPGRLVQMRGVLSVLGLDQAARAVLHMRDDVQALAQAPADAMARQVESLGNSLGALGFLIDMLGYQPALARKLFVFDEDTGELRPVMGRVPAPRPVVEAEPAWHAADSAVPVTEAVPPVQGSIPDRSETFEPSEPSGQVPEPEASRAPAAAAPTEAAPAPRASAGGPAISEAAAASAAAPVTDDATAPAPPAALQAPAPAPALPATPDDEQAELLGIFLDEAREVLQSGGQAVVALGDAPADAGQLTTLRRAFHTLKGSSRMVGLHEFGEAAWALEQVLNAWLADQQPASPSLLALAGRALEGLGRWVEDIAAGRDAAWRSAPFTAAAEAFRLRREVLDLPFPGDVPTDGQASPAAHAADEIAADAVVAGGIAGGVAADAMEPFPAAQAADPADAVLDGLEVQECAEDLAAFEVLADVAPLPAQQVPEAADAVPTPEMPEMPVVAAVDAAGVPVDGLAQAAADLCASLPPEPAPDAPTAAPEDTGRARAEADGAADAAAQADADADADADGTRRVGPLRIGEALFNVFLAEADDWSARLESNLSRWAVDPSQPLPDAAEALAHSLAGSSATVGFQDLSALARLLESSLQRTHGLAWATTQHAQAFTAAAEEVRRLLHQFAAGLLRQPDPAIAQALRDLDALDIPPRPHPAGFAPTLAPMAAGPADLVEPDLFPFFEDEALQLLPALGDALRRWQAGQEPAEARDQALRVLHTLKGSARLAGAMGLGERAHALESAVEAVPAQAGQAAAVDALLADADALQAAFEALCQAALADVPSAAPALPADPLPAQAPRPAGPLAAPAGLSLAPTQAAAGQAVRVRSHLLDRMMNQAGEVMITRSRLEAELRQLRGALTDLTGNLDRLRGQLRDVELQAELQMQSRLAQARESAQGFDPLEFDRFTRTQELTRMMAESVDDVATVQRTLQRTVDATEDDLAAQARQTRELHRDLLRTRMVEFESIAERLYRVVRQAARETGKQARLDIVGGAIEMDRAVLERMTPAFEHLLRNAVAHGLESPEARGGAGKEATGRIVIALAQEGNDVAVEFRDDGAGLDLARIQHKAQALGLLPAGAALDVAAAADLIFRPGFSTAAQVTGLAGRGIGMDVVRAEVQGLGGRIETDSQPGQHTAFRLVLPLTTAVTQVVLVRSGDRVFGVPAPLVEVVHRASAREVDQAYAAGALAQGEARLPFFWSGALLRTSRRSAEPPGRSLPVLVLRSASQRVAMHVDEVLGHQEVVVKHLGPQLARLPGLAAMTVLPSGAVVLIYNPVALAAVHGDEARAYAAALADPEADGRGGDAEAPAPEAGQVPLVLVVDDSITVRRVTQRLLLREGWRVALAADGLQALEMLARERPAVVLSDIEMPRMDGFDLLRNIRCDARWASLPVLMITSRIAAKHREHAMALGANHYLGKPYAEEELLGLVRRYAAAFLTTA